MCPNGRWRSKFLQSIKLTMYCLVNILNAESQMSGVCPFVLFPAPLRWQIHQFLPHGKLCAVCCHIIDRPFVCPSVCHSSGLRQNKQTHRQKAILPQYISTVQRRHHHYQFLLSSTNFTVRLLQNEYRCISSICQEICLQEAQLLQRFRVMRCVSGNYVNCCTTARKAH